MSHKAQRDFVNSVRCQFPEYFYGKRVLEIGSLNINGTVKDFFTDCDYLGIDIGEGPGVDLVVNGADFRSPTLFDVVISAECLEHNPMWRATFINMCELSTGLVVMTCAGRDRPEHGTTRTDGITSPLTVAAGWEYYENRVPTDFADLPLGEWFTRYRWTEAPPPVCDTYFYGIKR